MARKPVFLRGEAMTDEFEDDLIVKGNLSDQEFNAVAECYGYGLSSAEAIKHGWWRCEQCGDNGGYGFVLRQTEPHARGAFEATWIEGR